MKTQGQLLKEMKNQKENKFFKSRIKDINTRKNDSFKEGSLDFCNRMINNEHDFIIGFENEQRLYHLYLISQMGNNK